MCGRAVTLGVERALLIMVVLAAAGTGCGGVAVCEAAGAEAELDSTVTRTLALTRQGRYAEAHSLARSALEVAEDVHGAGSVEAAAALGLIMALRLQMGRAAEPGSRQMAERALKIRETVLDAEHPDVATSHNNLICCTAASSA